MLVYEGGDRIQVRCEIAFETLGKVTPEAHFADLERRARENVGVHRTYTRRVLSAFVHVLETKATAGAPHQTYVFYLNRQRFFPLIVIASKGATPEDGQGAIDMLLDARFKE